MTSFTAPGEIRTFAQYEREILIHALFTTGWNVKETATRLKIGRATSTGRSTGTTSARTATARPAEPGPRGRGGPRAPPPPCCRGLRIVGGRR